MAPAEALTPARRAVAAALLFLASAALAGVTLRQGAGVAYHVFGLTEGLFAILLSYIFLERRVWERPPGVTGWVAVVYGTVAGAQLLDLLLPPPGVLEWVVVVGLVFVAWAALGIGTRRRLVALLAGLSLLLALLKFSVIPFLWERSGPGPGEAFGLGNLAEGFRRLFVEYEPARPEGELLGVAAVGVWALATRLLWPSLTEEDEWLATLPVPVRRRLESPAHVEHVEPDRT